LLDNESASNLTAELSPPGFERFQQSAATVSRRSDNDGISASSTECNICYLQGFILWCEAKIHSVTLSLYGVGLWLIKENRGDG
jgi:hypothetical protein